ncbi:MAG TPA: hypothetical protein VGC34_08645, partial [Steroidobacteraceae bacterium]
MESHLLMHRLLPAVREMLGADWGSFCWHDDRCRMTTYVLENHMQLSTATTYSERRDGIGTHHGVQVTAHRGARAWGSLQLYRDRQAPCFDSDTEHALSRLGPYLALALRAPALTDDRFVATEDSGLLLTDPSGQITSINARTAGLLTLAANTATSAKGMPTAKVPD